MAFSSVMIHADQDLEKIWLDREVCKDFELSVLHVNTKGLDLSIFLDEEAERQLREALGHAFGPAAQQGIIGQVGHKDGDPANNEISNLEIVKGLD